MSTWVRRGSYNSPGLSNGTVNVPVHAPVGLHDSPIFRGLPALSVRPWGFVALLITDALGAVQVAVMAAPGRFCTVGATVMPYHSGTLPFNLTCRFLVHGVSLWQYVEPV